MISNINVDRLRMAKCVIHILPEKQSQILDGNECSEQVGSLDIVVFKVNTVQKH